jgi:protein-disulfide isomerase
MDDENLNPVPEIKKDLSTLPEKDSQQTREPKSYLPLSVIAAALLISASVFYNGKLIMQKLDALSPQVLGTNVAQDSPSNIQAQPQMVSLPVRANDPVIGNADAKLAIYEYSDFQCPFCQQFFKDTFGKLKAEYIDTGKVKFIVRNFPLPFHQNAQQAAEAAECANLQGKYQEYHDMLFNNAQPDGTGLSILNLKQYAADLKLNVSQFNQCLDSGQTTEIVQRDTDGAQTIAVSGTPTFLIMAGKSDQFDTALINQKLSQKESVITMDNGNVYIVGNQPFSMIEQAINQALK